MSVDASRIDEPVKWSQKVVLRSKHGGINGRCSDPARSTWFIILNSVRQMRATAMFSTQIEHADKRLMPLKGTRADHGQVDLSVKRFAQNTRVLNGHGENTGSIANQLRTVRIGRGIVVLSVSIRANFKGARWDAVHLELGVRVKGHEADAFADDLPNDPARIVVGINPGSVPARAAIIGDQLAFGMVGTCHDLANLDAFFVCRLGTARRARRWGRGADGCCWPSGW